MSITITKDNKVQYLLKSYPDITKIIWQAGTLDKQILENFPNLNHFEYNGVCLFYHGNWLDLNLLKFCPHLTRLSCSFNKITNLNFLENCPNLTHLCCNNNQIKDISPIKYCQRLTSLNCSNNLINDISSLESLTHLTVLSCEYNQIRDLNCFKNYNTFNWLSCGKNKITTLEPLVHLTMIEYLNYEQNELGLDPFSEDVVKLIIKTKDNWQRRMSNLVFYPISFKRK